MANKGPHTNGSQFFVSTGPLQWLERTCVAFGRVISGMRVVRVIEKLELKHVHFFVFVFEDVLKCLQPHGHLHSSFCCCRNERPITTVTIDACGQL